MAGLLVHVESATLFIRQEMPRLDPLDSRQGNAMHRSSSAPGGGGHGHHATSNAGDGGSSRHAASEGGASDHPDRAAEGDGHGGGAGPAVPGHPATIGRPTFRDCAINAVAAVPLLGGGGAATGGAYTSNSAGIGGGGSHSLESFASLLDSLRHFAKSSASGDEPEMSHGMRMRAEAGGAGA